MSVLPHPRYPEGPSGYLREAAFWLDRARATSRRPRALRHAAQVWDGLDDVERASVMNGTLKPTGIGPTSLSIITQAVSKVPEYVEELRQSATPLTAGGAALRQKLRGDLHCHSDQSDGSAPLAEMAQVAGALGHEYLLITDHSPRLKVARGLSAERVAQQAEKVARLNAEGTGAHILHGSEVDILADGSLDHSAATLSTLDFVVASVHSQLRMDSESMTLRMVQAVANPRVNVLGHCTGRLVEGERGTRPPSEFDAEVVFEACRQFNVAVEINSRPERCDPPDALIELARDMGCLFAIDTDAHAPGQLDFQWYGCERAEALGISPERIINTWTVRDLTNFAQL